jgi:hypothetical protein
MTPLRRPHQHCQYHLCLSAPRPRLTTANKSPLIPFEMDFLSQSHQIFLQYLHHDQMYSQRCLMLSNYCIVNKGGFVKGDTRNDQNMQSHFHSFTVQAAMSITFNTL